MVGEQRDGNISDASRSRLSLLGYHDSSIAAMRSLERSDFHLVDFPHESIARFSVCRAVDPRTGI
jgi:hypothetical protein